LAGIGDVRGLELLEQALGQDIGPSVRRAAARGLGQLQLESLTAEGAEAVRERCLVALERSETDGEWVVRYAVSVALESLALSLPPGDGRRLRACAALGRLRHAHHEDALVVRQRASLAQRRLDQAVSSLCR
jgi:phycocyanobilin lyase beta subunit